MPLRDLFRPPVSTRTSWEGFHGQWPAVLVQRLRTRLPPGYAAEPRVHFGSQVEVVVAGFPTDEALSDGWPDSEGGTATAVWAPAAPSGAVETELAGDVAYEVRVDDVERGRQLVAAVEIVSPGNKDRPEKRTAFVGKCAALLREGVAVCIVDLVTVRHFNLYAELMAALGHRDPTLGREPPAVYAAACRWLKADDRAELQTWSHVLAVGRLLPTLPLWLTATRYVPLELEASYEAACADLSIA